MKHFKKTKRMVLMLTLFMLVFSACEKSEFSIDSSEEQISNSMNLDANKFEGEIPEATVPLGDYQNDLTKETEEVIETSTLTPDIEATLKPEECHTASLTATIDGGPSIGDVMFIMDLTGSMGDELNNARNNSLNIMNEIRTLIPNTNFGLSSFMDYTGYHSGCGYSWSYASSSDYPYELGSELTSDLTVVETAFNSLNLGFGYDAPESYTRALWELKNDPLTGWRTGSKKIAILWGDAAPHDCNIPEYYFGSASSGPDVGRDGIANTADDLVFQETIDELVNNDIVLFTLFSGNLTPIYELWNNASIETGGQAFQINSDGTLPGGEDIGGTIASLINENLSNINELTLEVCDPAYEDWLTQIDPAAYYNLTLDSPIQKDFEVCITPPAGTLPGVYNFEICLVGDGAEYARTVVSIVVSEENIDVALDVHPTSCPNPLSPNSKGVFPVSINGSEDFDVNQIDLATVTMEGVSPVNSSIEDVSTPFETNLEEPLDPYSCTTAGPDGYEDLTLKFDYVELRSMLGVLERGDVMTLSISGQLLDGTEFSGADITIVK